MKTEWSFNGLTDLFTLWTVDEEGECVKPLFTFRAIKRVCTGILPYCINENNG